jgi:hypothetical protein
MADALASGITASLAATAHQVAPPPTPSSAAPTEPTQHVNLSAPAYISPAISFDPITNIVFLTFRNSETGEITEQIPPSVVLSRYRFVDETGIPDPILPRSTPNELAGTTRWVPSDKLATPASAAIDTSSTPPSGTFA